MSRTSTRRSAHSALAVILALLLAMIGVASASAYTNPVTYGGQGLIADGFGGYDLRTELCAVVDEAGNITNGADATGPYLLWVLTANKANKADITGPWGTAQMTKFGNGTFKYISGWYDPSTLPGNVTATYDGNAKNAQLVISHGCRPFTEGAWCSPGFWKNAAVEPSAKGPGAYALVGKSPTDLFDGFVYDTWFGNSLPGITLGTVLNDPPTYSGPPVAGTSGYALNAFNATGAALTNLVPGYQFDWDTMVAGGSDACPIDHFGNFK
jgi:hypothetical protein